MGLVRCFVCGEHLIEAQACGECGTTTQVQERLLAHTGRNRFLFGRVKQTDMVIPKAAAPQPKPKPKMAKPMVQPTPEPIVRAVPDADLIRNRDPLVSEVEAPMAPQTSAPLRMRTIAHVTDVIICMLLNYWIFQMVVWVSGRGAQPLMNFSLIPLLFVMLCFTVLYFWLFVSLFGKSLGRIVLDYLAMVNTR